MKALTQPKHKDDPQIDEPGHSQRYRNDTVKEEKILLLLWDVGLILPPKYEQKSPKFTKRAPVKKLIKKQ